MSARATEASRRGLHQSGRSAVGPRSPWSPMLRHAAAEAARILPERTELRDGTLGKLEDATILGSGLVV